IIIGDEHEHGFGALELDRGLGAFEVVALANLFLRLVDSVVDFLKVDAGGHVERTGLRHANEANEAGSCYEAKKKSELFSARSSRLGLLARSYPRYDSSARALDTCRSRESAFSLICLTRSRVIPSSDPICWSVLGS